MEHMNKQNGVKMLCEMEKLSKSSGLLITSTPQAEVEQGAIHGNSFQIHVSIWTKKELERFGYSVIFSPLAIRFPRIGHVFLPARNFNRNVTVNRIANVAFFFFWLAF